MNSRKVRMHNKKEVDKTVDEGMFEDLNLVQEAWRHQGCTDETIIRQQICSNFGGKDFDCRLSKLS